MTDLESMPTLTLLRVGSSDLGTFGVLRDRAIPFAVTMELPWKNNEARVSCIPPGRYTCQRVQSPKFGNTFEVTGVPGRDHILFHTGNSCADTEGCILVAEEFGGTMALPVISSSRQGYGELMRKLAAYDTFTLDLLDLSTT
jgi:hypothetical protein